MNVVIRAGYGPPGPAAPDAASPTMSRARAHVLAVLIAAATPSTLAGLVGETGLHANTLRGHLRGLEDDGLVRRERASPVGRGRPAWLYCVTPDQSRGAEYVGLATALAAMLHHKGGDPGPDAIAAGVQWGHELTHRSGRPVEGKSAHAQVVDLLEQIGFAPDSDPDHHTVVQLTACPLLAAARRYPDVVCAVHLGIVRGALEEYGAPAERTSLFPFSAPGACRLELSGVDDDPGEH